MSNVVNIFEYATRNKLRFNFKGLISVEDLWKLSIEDLDSIFKSYNKQKKELDNEESLIDTKTIKPYQVTDLDIKIDILKHIATVKTQERNAQLAAEVKAQKRQQIMQLITDKENAELRDKSKEELTQMLAELL